MSNARRYALIAIALLLALGAWAAVGLKLDSDLARFMPPARDADQRLLRGELGSGPASRVLLLAIDAGDDVTDATLSRQVAARLRADAAFSQVLNGEIDEAALLDTLLPLRFSYSPAMDQALFDADGLYQVLIERLADLGGAGGEAFETLLAHDPHFLTLALAESWRPLQEPELREGVWFTGNGEALLLVQTRAAGFDPQAQAAAIATIRATFAELAPADASLILTGPGSFSARMSERVAGEAGLLGGIAVVSLMVMLLVAYRSVLFVLASALPLACAAAAGVIALRLGFDQAHGITLAFAFTLIGVAQDYPVHLLSHLHPGTSPRDTARSLWPALRLGVASTAIAYASLFSGHAEGLAQLAVFTIAGLLTAALVSRYLLPVILPMPQRDVLDHPGFTRWAGRLDRMDAGIWPVLPVLALAGLALMFGAQRPWWNNDLASLTPLPPQWLMEDARLRAELASPDARYLLLLSATDRESVLRLSEALAPRLTGLVESGGLADHGLPSRYQPSARVQAWRLSRLPAPEVLRAALADAAEASGFDAAYFEPMVQDVAAARQPDAPARIEQALTASVAGERLAATFRSFDGREHALVQLSGLTDPQAVIAAVADYDDVRLLDLKQVAETMVVDFRQRVVSGLGVAVAAFCVLLLVGLGLRRFFRVLPPVLLGLVATVAVLRLLGIELTLFHLIALMLAAGLGMDYALFFNHANDNADRYRTLHAVLISAASTLLVFGLLAASAIPVLKAIGTTVAIGVTAQFVLALAMAGSVRKDVGHA